MAALTEPLIVAGIITAVGFAAISLFPRVEGEMEDKIVVRLLLGPLCLGALILILDGVADHLYLIGHLQP